MNQQQMLEMLSTGVNGHSYFNGTPCPIVDAEFVDYEKHANDMIKNMLKDGWTLDRIGVEVHKQMIDFEMNLTRICGGKGSSTNEDKVREWLDFTGFDEHQMNMLWYINVYTLLKLKVIENDDNNGMLFRKLIVNGEKKSRKGNNERNKRRVKKFNR